MNEKQQRVEKANQLIQSIANHGRKFFAHNGRVSRFEIDQRGRIWFVDAYNKDRIYTHFTQGKWRGFSEGGTLRSLIISLRDYIAHDLSIGRPFGPWPEWYSQGDPWGYGDDMKVIASLAEYLGISSVA